MQSASRELLSTTMWRTFFLIVTAAAGMLTLAQAQESLALNALVATDIVGNDFECGQDARTSCRICGGDISYVVYRCSTYPQCVAFVYDNSCGTLKTATGPTRKREGFSTYITGTKQTPGGGAPAPSLQLSPAPAAAATPALPSPAYTPAVPAASSTQPRKASPVVASPTSPSPAAAHPDRRIPTSRECSDRVQSIGQASLMGLLDFCQGGSTPSCCSQIQGLVGFPGSGKHAGCLCNADVLEATMSGVKNNQLAKYAGVTRADVVKMFNDCKVPNAALSAAAQALPAQPKAHSPPLASVKHRRWRDPIC